MESKFTGLDLGPSQEFIHGKFDLKISIEINIVALIFSRYELKVDRAKISRSFQPL
jgi:hypothetical protein